MCLSWEWVKDPFSGVKLNTYGLWKLQRQLEMLSKWLSKAIIEQGKCKAWILGGQISLDGCQQKEDQFFVATYFASNNSSAKTWLIVGG